MLENYAEADWLWLEIAWKPGFITPAASTDYAVVNAVWSEIIRSSYLRTTTKKIRWCRPILFVLDWRWEKVNI